MIKHSHHPYSVNSKGHNYHRMKRLVTRYETTMLVGHGGSPKQALIRGRPGGGGGVRRLEAPIQIIKDPTPP